jgi:hypothetical protein
MNHCPHCGHQRSKTEQKCPECGRFYSKIMELIAEEEAYEIAHSWRGRYQRIINAANSKQALLTELKQIWHGLPTKARFTLFVIFVFVFALVVSVL